MSSIKTKPSNFSAQTAVESAAANKPEQTDVAPCPWTKNADQFLANMDEGDRQRNAARAKITALGNENKSAAAPQPDGQTTQNAGSGSQSSLRSHFSSAGPSPTSKSTASAQANLTPTSGAKTPNAPQAVAGSVEVSRPNLMSVTPLRSRTRSGRLNHAERMAGNASPPKPGEIIAGVASHPIISARSVHADKSFHWSQKVSERMDRITFILENWAHKYLAEGTVEDNGSHIPCVAHSAVSVKTSGQTHYLHANHIHWSPSKAKGASATGGMNVVAAQAPRKFDACEKLVRHAIESKKGIFQIVGPQTHAGLSATQPIIVQLLAMGDLPAKLGDDCEVIALKQTGQTKNSIVYQLTVRSPATGVETTIPITQVGLRFDDALLRENEIEEAESVLNAHTAMNKELNPATVSEPVIISQAGVGRNATVIVYHAIMKEIAAGKITTEKELDAAMIDLIVESRRARGPHFLHSQAQLNELVGLLTKKLPKS